MRLRSFSKDQEGVASILGEVLTVGIVVGIVAVGGAAALGGMGSPGASTDTLLRATLDCGTGVWFDGDERIVIYHRGGPVIRGDQLTVNLNIEGVSTSTALDQGLATRGLLAEGGVYGGTDLSMIGAQYIADQKAEVARIAAAQAAAAASAAAMADQLKPADPEKVADAEEDVDAVTFNMDDATTLLDTVLNLLFGDDDGPAGDVRDAVKDARRKADAVAGVAYQEYRDDGVWTDPAVEAEYIALMEKIEQVEDREDGLPKNPSNSQLEGLVSLGDAMNAQTRNLYDEMVAGLSRSPTNELQVAADEAAAIAASAQAESNAAAAKAASVAGTGPTSFEVGAAFVSSNQRLREDAYITYSIINKGLDGASAVIADGLLTERLCGGVSTVHGALREVFGILPFIDHKCDGEVGPGDELLEVSDFADGHFVVTDNHGCLVIPPGVPPIIAESIHLEAPNGLSIGVDLQSTNGPIELYGGDGHVDITSITIASSEGVDISGRTIDASGADISAPAGPFRMQADDDTITAVGMKVVAGSPGGAPKPEPIVDLPDQSGPGSIRMCVALLDASNRVTNGWQWHGRTFTVGGHAGNPSMPPEGILPDLVIQAPIPMNADIFYDDGIKDAHCVLYNDLEIGGWYYKQGIIDDPTDWETSLHNDQNHDAITTVDDFFHYSGELFDADASNDDERNTNADGHISLSNSRPYRTMVALFRSTDSLQAEIAIDSDGGDVDVSGAEFMAYGSDVAIVSDGGDIRASHFIGTAAGDLGQVRLSSDGGDIDARGAIMNAPQGHVLVLADDGAVVLIDAVASGRYGVDIEGGPDIDVSRAQLTSTADHVDVLVTKHDVVVIQSGVQVSDSDGGGAVLPAPGEPGATAILLGSATSGGFVWRGA